MGVVGLIAGLVLIAVGFDQVHVRAGRARWLFGLLPLAGLALVGLSIPRIAVPNFFQ